MDDDGATRSAGRVEEAGIAPDAAELRRRLAGLTDYLRRLTEIGLALSGERDRGRLFEMIVSLARRVTGADAGTLYILDDAGRRLDFVVIQNDTLGAGPGPSGAASGLPPVELYGPDGAPNHANVSSHAALSREVVNIDDVSRAAGFDFTGPRRYDAATGYHSRSMLVVPLENSEGEVIGVLQLLNAIDPKTGRVTGFSPDRVEAVRSLAGQAAVALSNARLVRGLSDLLHSIMQAIAAAIDAKSPSTRGHIDRVAELTMRLAECVNARNSGPFAKVRFDADEMEELHIAAWLHDAGKIVTPVYVVDKASKLQTLFDRIELVRTRFHLIGESLRAECAERRLELARSGAPQAEFDALAAEEAERRAALADDLDFLVSCNTPCECMAEAAAERIRSIGARTYVEDGRTRSWLTPDEVENLCIRKGTLNPAERRIIERHAEVTIDMLSRLSLPKRLRRVPEFAGAHHEFLDGSGYPNHLKGNALALQSRILAVADVFEAMTAADRPYKPALRLSEALRLLDGMVAAGRLDADVVALLRNCGVAERYAAAHLKPEQEA